MTIAPLTDSLYNTLALFAQYEPLRTKKSLRVLVKGQALYIQHTLVKSLILRGLLSEDGLVTSKGYKILSSAKGAYWMRNCEVKVPDYYFVRFWDDTSK